MATTMHCDPNLATRSLINWGFFTAAELIDTLSAPFCRRISTSSTEEIPPPTVKGMSISSATLSTRSAKVRRCSSVAEISRNTSSSAPVLAYIPANSTGSPASRKSTKLTPFTVLPFLISKQGIILFVSIFYFLATLMIQVEDQKPVISNHISILISHYSILCANNINPSDLLLRANHLPLEKGGAKIVLKINF